MQGSLTARDALVDPKYRIASPFRARHTGHGRDIGRNVVPVRASVTGAPLKNGIARRPQNAEGEFFVDHRCIDCDVCRWMAPKTFTRVDEQSAVFEQPNSEEERFKALQALLCCPTSSIHTEKPPKDILEVQKTFPLPIDEETLPGVYHCGYHSKKSYGGTSYLIVHPEGNILVDSPSYKERLARNIDMLGGARYLFLTHKDDIADHDKWAKRLNCERIMHSMDIQPSTADVETQLSGSGPWSLGSDFEIIHTPGHTEGCICLLYKPLKVLFVGDHVGNRVYEDSIRLSIFEDYNWYSVPEQLNSVKKLQDFDFKWILPGHGRRAKFRDTQEKNSAIEELLVRTEQAHLQASPNSYKFIQHQSTALQELSMFNLHSIAVISSKGPPCSISVTEVQATKFRASKQGQRTSVLHAQGFRSRIWSHAHQLGTSELSMLRSLK